MMRLFILALLGSVFLTSLGATPITYTITGLMDGFIVPTVCPPPCLTPVFTGSAFTFEFNGDTSGIFHLTSSSLRNSVLSSSLTIAGQGSGHFTESLEVTDQTTSGTVGFADLALANSILLKNAALIGWDMATTIGPVGNTGLFLASTNKFDTSLGRLTVSDAFKLSFSAVVNTPEPATAGLVGVMLLAAAGLRKRIAKRL